MNYLADLIFDLRVRWLWFDDLVDFLWAGKCYHCDIVACSADQHLLAGYCDWLREQGPWTLEFVADNRVPPGEFVSLNHRGSGLLRIGDWVEVIFFARTGQPFDPGVVLEA
ncbi:hypothetical protein [uncultured Mediterranean phage uvMED]|nr:hypothetical protein [uncultured Mediterranean phage uvMED]